MAGILEKLKPLGFTPLVSRIKGEVLYYNFRGVGPVALDKSGHGNLGKLKPRGDPPRRKIQPTVPLEVIMAFDGKNDYIDVSDNPTLRFSSTFSVRFSIKLPSSQPQATPWAGIWGKRGSTDPDRNAYGGRIYKDERYIRFDLEESGGGLVHGHTHNLEPNVWHDIAQVADGKNCKIYVDNDLDVSFPYDGTIYDSSGNSVKIGYDYDSDKNGEFELKDFRIYNRPLSEDEI